MEASRSRSLCTTLVRRALLLVMLTAVVGSISWSQIGSWNSSNWPMSLSAPRVRQAMLGSVLHRMLSKCPTLWKLVGFQSPTAKQTFLLKVGICMYFDHVIFEIDGEMILTYPTCFAAQKDGTAPFPTSLSWQLGYSFSICKCSRHHGLAARHDVLPHPDLHL